MSSTSKPKSKRSNTHKSASTKKNLAYKEFREGYKKWAKKVHDKSRPLDDNIKTNSWDHKQLCMKHQIYPELISKYFNKKELPPSLFKMCQCKTWNRKVYDEGSYEGILRISLDKALKNADCNAKDAHFADLTLSINNDEIIHSMQMLKIKVGAVKRYTQPGTNKQVIGTATFWDGRLYVEGAHGIREDKKKNSKCFQFFAIHNNDFVSKQSLKENLERISIWLHKKKEIKYEVKATINGIPMQSHKLVKRERDPQHLETFSVMKENTNTNNMPLPLKKEEDQLSGCFTEFSQSTSQSSQSNNSWNRSQTPLAETPLPTPSATPKRDRHHSHHSHHGHNRKRNRICLDPEDGIGHGMRSRSASAVSSWSVNEDDKENQGNHNSNKHRDKDDIIQELRHRIKEMEKRHKREEKKWRDDMKQHKKDKCKWEQEKKRLMEANSKLTEQCLDRNNKFMPQIGPNGSIILSQDRYLSLSQDNDEVSDIMEPPRKKMKLEHNYTI